MPKLLSPAGDAECLRAAVNAGADEVYFGLSDFNARKNAKNFTLESGAEAIRFCRLHGVKTHITLNTLLYRDEFAGALKLVKALEGLAAPDAYIVQDVGLAFALSERFPGICLHASTQLQVQGSYGNELLKSLGFSRVVLAREASAEDIRLFAASGIETEIFIHGAMCVCRSGGCLMSSMIGKRSGNRGDCAYPCRMEYNGRYPLSLKDMCLAEHIPEIAAMGVTALKIEGRMKAPEYVYGVTSVYRRLLDENRAATAGELEKLKALFSRSGFTDGYYTAAKGSVRGKGMFGVRTEADKELTRAAGTYTGDAAKRTEVNVTADFGAEAKLTLEADGFSGTAHATVRQDATGAGTDKTAVEKQLLKLGATEFTAGKVSFTAFEPGYYPLSALNNLRREAVTALENSIVSGRAPVKTEFTPLVLKAAERTPAEMPVMRFDGCINRELLEHASRIEVPLWKEEVWRSLAAEGYAPKLSPVVTGFVFDTDADDVRALISRAREAGITSLTLPNLTYLSLKDGMTAHGDYALNCVSREDADVFATLGFSTVCASPEAKAAVWNGAEIPVYGRITLMNTRTCVIKNVSPCMNGRGTVFTDRTGAKFPVACGHNHSNVIYNSVPLWLLDKSFGCTPVMLFTDESEERQAEIYSAFLQKKTPDVEFTRAYMK